MTRERMATDCGWRMEMKVIYGELETMVIRFGIMMIMMIVMMMKMSTILLSILT